MTRPSPPAAPARPDAILLLTYGGPDSLDDIPTFLSAVRGGRPTPPLLLAEISRRYALIGGRSPLLAITRRIADRLSEATGSPVYVGMRHWQPTIAETVRQMAGDGVRRCVAICLAPHYSRLSVGAYRARLGEALAGVNLQVVFIESWHTAPAYLDGVAAAVRETLPRFGADPPVKVIFTAHSLPASILAEGDPYDGQLEETARLVAARLGLPDDRWTRCYQSAAQTGVPWLGPSIEALMPQLAAAGERNLVVAPIGFIAEQVEILYDLDIGLREIATQCGARVERTPMLNDSPPLIAALAEIFLRQTGG
jgi:protoporphyrin/coproporphyrin ferrochelatase